MSSAALAASYISPRQQHEKHPPSPWEYHRGRKPFMHYSTPKTPSTRRNRTLGRILICFVALVIISLGLRGWFAECEGTSCIPQSLLDTANPYIGGGAVLPPPQATNQESSDGKTAMILIPADNPQDGAFADLQGTLQVDVLNTGNEDNIGNIGSDGASQEQIVAHTQAYGDVSGGDAVAVIVQDSAPEEQKEVATPDRQMVNAQGQIDGAAVVRRAETC